MILSAILIGLIAGLAIMDSRIFGDNMLGRPIIIGPLIGFVLGDFTTGLIVGGTLELIYMGIVGIGATISVDVITGSTVATSLAIISGWPPEVAVSAAIPISAVTIKMVNYTKSLNSYWFQKAEIGVNKFQFSKVEWMHRGGYLLFFLQAFIPSFLIIYLFTHFAESLSAILPKWLVDGLIPGAGLLTAIGFATLISMIFTKRLAPFYFGGFLLAAYFGLNVTGVVAVALIIALIMNQIMGRSQDDGAGMSASNHTERVIEDGNLEDTAPGNGRDIVAITRKDLMKVFWRSLSLLGSFSFERLQGLGYGFVMLPILRKLYRNEEELSLAVKRHLGFFNTAPWLSTFIFGVTIAMEEENANKKGFDTNSISAVKMGLMGSIAGIGDSLFWGTLRIISAGIGASLVIQGNAIGILIYVLLFNIPHYFVRYHGLFIGYKVGTRFLSNVLESGIIQKITYGASIVGLMTIGGMTASLVKFSTPLVYNFNGTKWLLQDILNQIFPSLLPLAYTMLMFYLINKKQVKISYLIYGTLVFGILAKAIGFM
jgi:fructoselysine and glucoselysine-specific PTS system IID component